MYGFTKKNTLTNLNVNWLVKTVFSFPIPKLFFHVIDPTSEKIFDAEENKNYIYLCQTGYRGAYQRDKNITIDKCQLFLLH